MTKPVRMRPPQRQPQRQPLSRRAFLKLSAAGAVGWGFRPAWAAAPLAGPRLAATLRVPFPHTYCADPDVLLARPPAGFDLLLVPAYIAAGLIQRALLQPLAGPPGRAHDPEGAYTVPYRLAVSAVVHPAGAAPDNPWQASVAWPAHGRLVLGAALQRRGFSPNDTHAGHLAQAGADVWTLRPVLGTDPLAALHAGAASAAFLPVPFSPEGDLELDEGLAATLPPWGRVLIEYDWVLPAKAPDVEAALAFLSGLPPVLVAPSVLADWRPVPLAPLPSRAQAQHTRLWADLTRARREAGS